MSTPTTVCPSFERHAAVTAPTYPRPTTTTFICEAVLPSRKGRTDTLRQGKVSDTPARIRRQSTSGAVERSTIPIAAVGATPSIVAMTLWRLRLFDDALARVEQSATISTCRLPQCGSRSRRLSSVGGNEIDIALYADVLRRHRVIVLVGVVLTVALGRVVLRSGLPFGDLLPLARDLVESGDARVDAGGSAGAEVGASRPSRRVQPVTGRHGPLRESDRRLRHARHRVTPSSASSSGAACSQTEDLKDGASSDHRGRSAVHGQRCDADDDHHRDILDRPEGDQADVGVPRKHFSTFFDARQLAAKIPVKDRIQVRVVKSSEAPKLVDPRSKALPMLVSLGGLIATLAIAFTRDNVARRGTGSRADDSGVPRRTRRARLVGRCHQRPTDAQARPPPGLGDGA